MKPNLETVIKERLKLDTNQRILAAEFKIPFATLEKVKNIRTEYKNWDEDRKKRFLITLGGPINYKKTLNYFENLVK